MVVTTSKRNNAIELFRYVCAVLVVNIHGHPLLSFSETANFIAMEHVGRIAVPFFFIVSGYFYSLRHYAGKKPFGSYLKKLFLIYTMWSVVYAVELIILRGGTTKAQLFKMLLHYLYNGVSQHLWFCLALMVAVCVLELTCRLKAEKGLFILTLGLFTIGCFGDTYYYAVGQYLPLLNKMYQLSGYIYIQRYAIYGISFVMLGNLVARKRERLLAYSDKALAAALAVFTAAAIGERLTAALLGWAAGGIFSFCLYPMMLALFVLLLKHPAPQKAKAAAYLGATASFMYFFHPIILDFMDLTVGEPVLSFAVAVAVCTAIGCALKRLNSKTVNYWLL